MRKLSVGVLALFVVWLLVELAAVPLAEGRLEQQVADRVEGAADVRADINSFPLLMRIVLTSTVSEVTVTLERVARQQLTFAEVRFELEGIEVDRSAALRREPRVTAVDRGTITATIDAGALSPELSRIVPPAGQRVRVRGRALLIGPASVVIPSDLLPCDPEARVEGDSVMVSCTIHEVPTALLESAQS